VITYAKRSKGQREVVKVVSLVRIVTACSPTGEGK
jgi:hypothetical protein